MGHTDQLADFVESFTWDHVSAEVLEKCKMHVLDTIGIALRGSKTEHIKQTLDVVKVLKGDPVCTVFGHSFRTNVHDAAFLNATMAHSIDFDDAHKFIHPGAVIVPVALNVAEWKKMSGKELIKAILVGYEISIRLSLAAGLKHRKKGYHPTSACNYIGATAVASKLLQLNRKEIVSAFGLACTQAAGLTQYRFDGSPNKHLHAGLAAKGGVLSALMAHSGFQGTMDSLEGTFGFLNVLADGGNPNLLTEHLGEKMSILDVDIKPYPSCRQTHAPIDLILEVTQQHDFTTNQIEKIELYLYEYATESWLIDKSLPTTPLQAMLNIPYCIAVALLDEEVTLEQFTEARLKDSKINDITKKVIIKSKQEFTERFPEEKNAEVIVRLKDGSVIHKLTRNPLGSKDKPLTYTDVQNKFKRLVEPMIKQDKIKEIMNWVNSLEEIDNMDELLMLLNK